ncbi:MAG: hypothetical protein B7C24_14155 [Bacteroidetes bacterium 4572_77]|nr:MAG: hypothetical protein B7C24_14155 [Bacteroidetes bacterium 4572_77]
MISIGKTIVSEEVIKKQFSCDLGACKGECCVQGDSGAPLEEEEIGIIEDALEEIFPYMTPAGKEAVQLRGVFDYDEDGDFVTTLVEGQECAFVYFENDIALCAIEKAYRDGKIKYYKPISCHLYPIRISKYSEFEAINYHRWHICDVALAKGKKENIAVYEYLKEPLIRKYGVKWYAQLEEEVLSGRYDEILKRD